MKLPPHKTKGYCKRHLGLETLPPTAIMLFPSLHSMYSNITLLSEVQVIRKSIKMELPT